MPQVQVFHSGEHVANINYPLPITNDVLPALEFAWRWTNNVEGSWSMPETFPNGDFNGDYNRNTTVIKPLYRDEKGKTWGHRSSMVGDVFKIDGEEYTVASFGFKKANGEEV